VFAVIGPNGSGKSTLLNSISGILGKNATGSIMVGGKEIGGLSPASRAHLGIGRSFQDPPLVGTLTVLENILVGSHTMSGYNLLEQLFRWRKVGHTERQLRERAGILLDFVGLAHLADEPAAGIPYGPRKLVDVARALMCGPRFLLLDEPTSGLDRGEQATIVRILDQLRASGRLAVLVVEHHMDVVRACTNRVIGLQAGEVIADGATADVLDSEDFRAALVSAS
jgi:branched-chain amino acid transport system ATP-binding protein